MSVFFLVLSTLSLWHCQNFHPLLSVSKNKTPGLGNWSVTIEEWHGLSVALPNVFYCLIKTFVLGDPWPIIGGF